MAVVIKHVKLVELLIGLGADPNTLDKAGRCPITNLLWYHHSLNTHNGEVDDDVFIICIMLTQAGTNLNMSRYEHSNCLCMAVLYRLTGLVQYFLGSGADQNNKFYCNVTPLQIATKNRDVKTVKVLLNWHSDLYLKGRVIRGHLDYNTDVFCLAIDIGAFDIAILLSDTGYDVSHVPYLVDWSLPLPDTLLGNDVMLQFFREKAMVVDSLFKISVLTIRRALKDSIAERAQELPLPKSIIAAVQFKDDLT